MQDARRVKGVLTTISDTKVPFPLDAVNFVLTFESPNQLWLGDFAPNYRMLKLTQVSGGKSPVRLLRWPQLKPVIHEPRGDLVN